MKGINIVEELTEDEIKYAYLTCGYGLDDWPSRIKVYEAIDRARSKKGVLVGKEE